MRPDYFGEPVAATLDAQGSEDSGNPSALEFGIGDFATAQAGSTTYDVVTQAMVSRHYRIGGDEVHAAAIPFRRNLPSGPGRRQGAGARNPRRHDPSAALPPCYRPR